MPNIFRSTGLLPLIIWTAFFIAGIVKGRPVICIISAAFFILGFYRRMKIVKEKDPTEVLWNDFVSENPEMKDYPYQFWNFNSDDEKMLFEKMKNGMIQGQSFSVDFFEANNQPLPQIGQINILCCNDKPIGICQTTDIVFSSFDEVDTQLAKIEGFTSLGKWRASKKRVFEVLCDRMGMDFSGEFKLLFEKFKVLCWAKNKEQSKIEKKIDSLKQKYEEKR